MQVDGRVGLRRRHRQARRRAEDVVRGEELVLPDLLHARLHPAQRARAHDREPVLLRIKQLLQDRGAVDAGLGFGFEGLDHLAELAGDVAVDFGGREGEAVLGLQARDDAAEVLPDEGGHEVGAGVAVGDALLLAYLVGELGAGFEGELLGEDEGVVAVEEELSYLERVMGEMVRRWGFVARTRETGRLTFTMIAGWLC